MAVDPRITKAKKVLNAGLAAGERARNNAPSRSTGLRQQFKAGHEAAVKAYEALSAPPKRK